VSRGHGVEASRVKDTAGRRRGRMLDRVLYGRAREAREDD
jgi:hypothetical protein